MSVLGIADRVMDAATGPQIAFYRGISQSLFFAGAFLILRKHTVLQEFRALTWRGWFAGFIMSLSGFFLIMSFQFTLVANAVFFISLTPIIAALMAWLVLKEPVDRRTFMAMIIAFIGVAIIFGTNMNADGVVGMLFALMMSISYAAAIVTIRTIPSANIILICTLSGLFMLVLMLPLIGDFTITQKDLLICLVLGVVQVGLGTLFIMLGARFVPAAQVSILALLEVVLGPIWVWIFASEVPSAATLIGGAIVFAGVMYQALGVRDSRPVRS